MITLLEIKTIVHDIEFKLFDLSFGWRVFEKGDGFLIQLCANIPDCETGVLNTEQKGGKHYLSNHATRSEVYFKAWKACQDYVTHEMHESFYVNGVRLFDPHLDAEDLIDKISKTKRTSRDGSWYPDHITQTELP